MNNTPCVSICIPTYNRARYLDSLLSSLADSLTEFPHSFEVLVADNCSEDNTQDVVARYLDRLPLRYTRHDSNLGGAANWEYLLRQANGRFFVYVADDDGLLCAPLAQAITIMEAMPDAGVAYAPWTLFDLVANQDLGQFYKQDDDFLVERHDFPRLLDILLKYGIFPEIAVYRCDVLRAIMPRVPEQAFYAFVHSAEFAQQGHVLFLKDSFYLSVTNYFVDHQRQQAGTDEAEYAWDRYRGGLEYVLGRARPQITEQQRLEFMQRIQSLIASRIAVAVRLRIQRQRDPVETYYLASRLKAMGSEQLLPTPLEVLAVRAALTFLTRDKETNRDMSRMLCVGSFRQDIRQMIEEMAQIPVAFTASKDDLGTPDENTLVFALDSELTREALPPDFKGRLIQEKHLMRKFIV
jgi:poly(ribitol-phosphate) beta-N-acetylglucosaminyltransferase